MDNLLCPVCSKEMTLKEAFMSYGRVVDESLCAKHKGRLFVKYFELEEI